MHPRFRFSKSGEVDVQDKVEWRHLCTLSGTAKKWTIELPEETMGPYRTRQMAAVAFADRFFTKPWKEENRQIMAWWQTQPHHRGKITGHLAGDIFDILVEECGAFQEDRPPFVHNHTTAARISTEFRFSGHIGFGGKFRNHSGWWVDCYPEEEDYDNMRSILAANQRLKALWINTYGS